MKFSAAQAEHLVQLLQKHAAADVWSDEYHRALFSTDAGAYQVQPLAVVFPRDADEVRRVVELAAEHHIPVTPRGAGTTWSGSSLGEGVVVDFSKHLHRLVDFDLRNRTAQCEPGLTVAALHAAVAGHGLEFAPADEADGQHTLGGLIGAAVAGPRAAAVGPLWEHIVTLRGLVADGSTAVFGPLSPEAWQARQQAPGVEGRLYRAAARVAAEHSEEIQASQPRTPLHTGAYDLRTLAPLRKENVPNLVRLLCGSQGTLALTLEVKVRLQYSPRVRALAVWQFASVADAIAAGVALSATAPSAVELLDSWTLRRAAGHPQYRRGLDFVNEETAAVLVIELSGDHEAEVKRGLAELRSRLPLGLEGGAQTLLLDPQQMEDVRSVCRASRWLLHDRSTQRQPLGFIDSAVVPVESLAEFHTRCVEVFAAEGVEYAVAGHIPSGALQFRPALDTRNGNDLARLERIARRVSEIVTSLRGSLCGQHAAGLALGWLDAQRLSPRMAAAVKSIKLAADPHGLFNPGKVLDPPPPSMNLRHSPDHVETEPPTKLALAQAGGLAGAASMCSGAGLCRKLQGGLMCPSYRATRDEEHSTRGRADALRVVLSGKVEPAQLGSRKLFDTFSLCLQCKGCQSECPSQVDVGRMKSEFLDQYYAVHGIPRRAQWLGQPAWLMRWGSALAPVANMVAQTPGVRWLAQQALGIDRRRDWPLFHRQNFRRWFAATRRKPRKERKRGPIVLLDDCLTTYSEPRLNRAAVEVLEAVGYEVHLAGLECCGRAAFSQGLLSEAQRLAKTNLDRLKPWLDKGTPIVGCEPSCLLMLADEYASLVPGDAATRLRQQARTIETHLVREFKELPVTPRSKTVLLHTHCHQRALVGADDSRRLLLMAPGMEVDVLDAGCCGMAGAFGYEHYDLSMQIGELGVLPAVRRYDGAAVVATGFSCRQQIAAGSDRLAAHPIEHIARQLEPEKVDEI